MNWISLQLWGFAGLVLLSAFFSSAEVAYTGLTLAQLRRIKRIRPLALELWETSPDRVLATLLLSNNAVNLGVGVLTASLAMDMAHEMGWRLSWLTVLMSFLSGTIVLLFGEILPKVWAKHFL